MATVHLLGSSYKRGVTLRRVARALREPSAVTRNAKFLFPRTTSGGRHVFVVGAPRSGTTLMQRLLLAHSRLCGPGCETRFFFRRSYHDLELPGLPDDTLKRLVRESCDVVDLFDRIADYYCSRCGAARFVEKSPEHTFRLPSLMRRFPRAQFVCMLRDGRDALVSTRTNLIRTKAAAEYARVWRDCVRVANGCGDPQRLITVRYERLCRDPEGTLASVMQFIGLPCEPSQLDPEAHGMEGYRGVPGHDRLTKRISAASVGQWREMLAPEEVAIVEAVAGPELRASGYDLSGPRRNPTPHG